MIIENSDFFEGDPSNTWRTHTEYEIREGRIFPCAGTRAMLYYPNDSYENALKNAQKGSRSARTPYTELFDVLEMIGYGGEERHEAFVRIANDVSLQEKYLLPWCNKYGLLGIMPYMVSFVRLYPIDKVIRRGAAPLNKRTGMTHATIHPSQISYHRIGAVWKIWLELGDCPSIYKDIFEDEADYWTRTTYEKPSQLFKPLKVTIKRLVNLAGFDGLLDDPPTIQETLEEVGPRYLGKNFFVEVPEKIRDIYQYPPPQSHEFWKTYSENLLHFLEYAFLLKVAVDELEEVRKGKIIRQKKYYEYPEQGSVYLNEMTPAAQQDLLINGLIADVTPGFAFDPGDKWSQEWSSPSLLSSLAHMAYLDYGANRFTRKCNHCRKIFSAKRRETKYCSSTCRSTYNRYKTYERAVAQCNVDKMSQEEAAVELKLPLGTIRRFWPK